MPKTKKKSSKGLKRQGGGLTKEVAKLILEDGTIRGKKLTAKQVGFFKKVAGK